MSDRWFESGFEDQSAFSRPRFLGLDIRPRVLSNLVHKLSRYKETSAINMHWQIATPFCLLFGFQISGRISKTLHRGFKLWPRIQNFPFVPGNEFPRNQIISDIDLVRDVISLFKLGIKTVVHIVIKYDKSQIKMEK